LDKDYVIATILQHLLDGCMSPDLALRHGSLLAVGKVLRGLKVALANEAAGARGDDERQAVGSREEGLPAQWAPLLGQELLNTVLEKVNFAEQRYA
jgi:hypothetical protein